LWVGGWLGVVNGIQVRRMDDRVGTETARGCRSGTTSACIQCRRQQHATTPSAAAGDGKGQQKAAVELPTGTTQTAAQIAAALTAQSAVLLPPGAGEAVPQAEKLPAAGSSCCPYPLA